MPDTLPITPGEMPIPPELTPNIPPIYAKCLTCPDYGASCRGLDLRYLGDVNAVRAFHRALKKSRPNITLKAIAAAAPTISEDTISEYFSNVVRKDFKWTTVVTIDNALLTICGNRIGLPPIDHSCPESSSGVRNRLATADLKIAAMQAECDDLRRRLSDSDGSHLSQLEADQAAKSAEVEWFKQDLKFWRRFSFALLGVVVILLAALVFYIGWDVAHADQGLIR